MCGGFGQVCGYRYSLVSCYEDVLRLCEAAGKCPRVISIDSTKAKFLRKGEVDLQAEISSMKSAAERMRKICSCLRNKLVEAKLQPSSLCMTERRLIWKATSIMKLQIRTLKRVVDMIAKAQEQTVPPNLAAQWLDAKNRATAAKTDCNQRINRLDVWQIQLDESDISESELWGKLRNERRAVEASVAEAFELNSELIEVYNAGIESLGWGKNWKLAWGQ